VASDLRGNLLWHQYHVKAAAMFSLRFLSSRAILAFLNSQRSGKAADVLPCASASMRSDAHSAAQCEPREELQE